MIGLGNDVNVFLTKAALEHLLGPSVAISGILGRRNTATWTGVRIIRNCPLAKLLLLR